MRRGAILVVLVLSCGDDGGRPSADAPRVDAALAADGVSLDGEPWCAGASCDSTQYCYLYAAGARAPRRGGTSDGCNALPAECDADRTCDCVLMHADTGCPITPSCEAVGGRITVACYLP